MQTTPTARQIDSAIEHHACGWYESSFDLRAGLTVTEDLDPILFELWSETQAGADLGLHH